mmetsp:Transcript_43454/g.98197  ORF Transcript_43454/g.98197 Transcript_43454/m.98197 type:complete len:254 (-) Transcript_43454:134-895(-)
MVTRPNAASDSEPLVHSSCNGAAVLGVLGGYHGDWPRGEGSSIFACDDLTAVLIDMGLARRESELCNDAAAGIEPFPTDSPAVMRRVATPAWSAIGSPGFMAPEQIRDARTAGHPADMYGLGTTWYALLAGVLPFSGSTPHKVMQQVLRNEVQPVSVHAPSVPKAVEALLDWMLQGEPRARPLCSPSFVAEIEAVLSAPHDEQRVRRARKTHDIMRRREDMLAGCIHAATLSVGVLLFAWLVWEALTLQTEVG